MKRFAIFQWVAALALAITLTPGAASAQEDGTITISSTFTAEWLDGIVGLDLADIYANGHEHTWTLTLHGTTHSHSTSGGFTMNFVTEIHATSFDLEFFGPDAATLNSIVRDHIAGGDVRIYLLNAYSLGFGDDFAVWDVSVFGPEVEFWTGELSSGWNPLFPSDANGYPAMRPEPFSIWAEDHILTDNRLGNDGRIGTSGGLVTFDGSVGEPEPGVLAVADASVLEGNRGTSNVAVTVTLSSVSSQAGTVHYSTANGTAVAKSDYNAASGTLTIPAGQTQGTISIGVKGDRKREANETFSVQLSNAAGATIADGVATVTIMNDD